MLLVALCAPLCVCTHGLPPPPRCQSGVAQLAQACDFYAQQLSLLNLQMWEPSLCSYLLCLRRTLCLRWHTPFGHCCLPLLVVKLGAVGLLSSGVVVQLTSDSGQGRRTASIRYLALALQYLKVVRYAYAASPARPLCQGLYVDLVCCKPSILGLVCCKPLNLVCCSLSYAMPST